MAVVMLVTAMLVVVMVGIMMMAVIMVAMIVATMTVFGMIVTCMFLRFIHVAAAGISAAFRIERCFDLDHPRTQPFHHVFDDVIATDA